MGYVHAWRVGKRPARRPRVTMMTMMRGEGDKELRGRRTGRIKGIRLGGYLPCLAYFLPGRPLSSQLQVGRRSRVPLAIAGVPRMILDSTRRTLLCACARKVRGPDESRREKHGVGNIRTEYDALRTTVIRCCDCAETFLACGVLRYRTTDEGARKKASQRLPFRTE